MAYDPKIAKEIAALEERRAKAAKETAALKAKEAQDDKDILEYQKVRHALASKGITKAGYLNTKDRAREEARITVESKKHVDLANQLGKLVEGSSSAAAKLIGLNSKSLELREKENQRLLEVLANDNDQLGLTEEQHEAIEEKVKANNALSEIQKDILMKAQTGTLTNNLNKIF